MKKNFNFSSLHIDWKKIRVGLVVNIFLALSFFVAVIAMFLYIQSTLLSSRKTTPRTAVSRNVTIDQKKVDDASSKIQAINADQAVAEFTNRRVKNPFE